MKISISKTHTEEVTIPVPSFWKNPCTAFNEYIGFVNENTVAKVLLMDDYCTISNGTAEQMIIHLRDAHLNFNLCAETDFLSAYDEALLGMSLKPVKSYEQQLRDLMKETNGKEVIPNDAVCDNRS